MTTSQYKNIIDKTVKTLTSEEKESSVGVAIKILKNNGLSLPDAEPSAIKEVLAGGDYLGWEKCSDVDAQAAANDGIAVVGVSDDRVVVVEPELDGVEKNENANVTTVSDLSDEEKTGMSFYSGGRAASPYVDIPQDGDLGTVISYMGYHCITSTSSNQYKLKMHARNNGRYKISSPEYYAKIDNRIVIATKQNIGNKLSLSIGDYVEVEFKNEDGNISPYFCIIGDFKGSDANSIWGHYDGKGVVEVVYHDYDPPADYNANKNNPWGKGRVIKIRKTGNYGSYTS